MKAIRLLFLILALCLGGIVQAQRPMDKLDRSIVAQKVTGGVYVNWRITADEWYNTSYKLYRDGSLIYTAGPSDASNYTDAAGTTSSKYTVTSVHNGVESAQSKVAAVLTNGYIEIPLRNIKQLGKLEYYPNDATAADLDGDGQYEVIIKRMNRDWATENTSYTYFEAYKLDGTFMWAIDVGPNITMDVEINIAAFDFDGDGKAEVFMRTSEGTVFGDGTKIPDMDGDGVTNYRYSCSAEGFMNAGPEFLSLIDGMTGKELDRVNFIARGSSSDWGDGYGHRANKFFFGAPYLDGIHPSLFIGRGIYTQTKMVTYDVINKKLVKRWAWESGPSGSYYAQGNHNYTIADTDGDGCDEIVWGSMCVDHNGTGLYSTELGHGDALHVGDFDPYYKGTEVFACNEAHPGLNLRDGKTGKILIRHVTASDCGRCNAGNISDAYKGAELWGGGVGYSATTREQMTHFGTSESYCMYWDGDLLSEMCYHRNFSTTTGVGYGEITKFNGYGNISTLLATDTYSCNYTKGTPCLQADIVGDWREEAIWWRKDSLALRIYVTPYPTTNRIYSLMHDHQYRQAICWQMCGYNQPPHPSFYLGSDFPTPIPPKSTNGKLVWAGSTIAGVDVWDSSSKLWMEGDSAVGMLKGTPVFNNFTNNRQVLFDTHGLNRSIILSGTLSPELMTVSGTADYSFTGTGMLAGNMILDKMGEGTLLLTGTHPYTGTTTVWEGKMFQNGTLTQSPVMVRRHAGYGGTGTSGKGISTEYNASIYIGGEANADTMTVNGTLNLAAGAKLVFDLSDNPNVKGNPSAITSGKKNDYLKLNGILNLTAGAVISVNQTVDSMSVGSYKLAKVDSIFGNLASVVVEGTLGVATVLSYDAQTKDLILTVKGVRNASTVAWTGTIDSNWNMATTANWSKNGFKDIFVSQDSVYFTDDATNRTVNLVGTLPVTYMEVDNSLDYTIAGTGDLTGPMTLVKKNTGKLTINNRNSFTGKTIVEGGTLVLKYLPSTTANGGIGTNVSDETLLTLKDSAQLQVTTANEATSRGLTVAGTAGGLMNVTSNIYWNGVITGTKLTKLGSANLYLASGNPDLAETVLTAGSLVLNASAAVYYGAGQKLTLKGGTLSTMNSIGSYLTCNTAFDVPGTSTASITAGARCEYNGKLTGYGTLNWACDYIRCYLNADWSGFYGKLNLTANSANSTYEDHFIFNNSLGMPNATVSIGNGVRFCYKNGTSDNGTTLVKLGLLTGVSGAEFYNAGLQVGSTNLSGSYDGIITGSAYISKIGTGMWTLSGANTYTGTTTVSAGTLVVSGTKSGTGTVSVEAGSVLNVTGTLAGNVTLNAASGTKAGGRLLGTGKLTNSLTVNAGAAISPADSAAIGTLTIGGSLLMTGGTYLAQVAGGVEATSDKLAITGSLTCSGILKVVKLNATPLYAGHVVQLFSAAAINGTFTSVQLPALTAGLEWNTTELYTTGKISVQVSAAILNPQTKIGLLQNPTDGIFKVSLGAIADKLTVTVSDLQGRVVRTSVESVTAGLLEVNLTQLPDGVYMMRLEAEDQSAQVLKLVKKAYL
jgi:autotransporter-associated beta strand protein